MFATAMLVFLAISQSAPAFASETCAVDDASCGAGKPPIQPDVDSFVQTGFAYTRKKVQEKSDSDAKDEVAKLGNDCCDCVDVIRSGNVTSTSRGCVHDPIGDLKDARDWVNANTGSSGGCTQCLQTAWTNCGKQEFCSQWKSERRRQISVNGWWCRHDWPQQKNDCFQAKGEELCDDNNLMCVWTQLSGKAISGDGCTMAAYNSVVASGATWRSSSSLFYQSLSDCKELCEGEAACHAFVDNHQASPKYCVFKLSTNAYSKSSKDVWTYQASSSAALLQPMAKKSSDEVDGSLVRKSSDC